jgi:hypothetical protein
MLEIVEDGGLLRLVACGAESAISCSQSCATQTAAKMKNVRDESLDIIASSDMCRHECLLYVLLLAMPAGAADLFYDDFSHFPAGWLTNPLAC